MSNSVPSTTSIEDRKSDDVKLDEKRIETATILSVDSKDVDAALELVGTVRTSRFSDEYNAMVRKKLVRVRRSASWISTYFCRDRTGLSLPCVQRFTLLSSCMSLRASTGYSLLNSHFYQG